MAVGGGGRWRLAAGASRRSTRDTFLGIVGSLGSNTEETGVKPPVLLHTHYRKVFVCGMRESYPRKGNLACLDKQTNKQTSTALLDM